MSSRPTKQLVEGGTERGAQACLFKMTPQKRRLVRAFEALLLPFVWVVKRISAKGEPTASDVAQILVAEYWNIGDIVILLPFLESLRAAYPAGRIILLANPAMRDLLEHQDFVDEIIPFVTPWSSHFNRWQKYNPFSRHWIRLARMLMKLRQRRFDIAFTGRMDIRDNFLIWLIGPRQRVGYGVGGGGFLLTDVVVPDLNRPHRSQAWLQLLRHLGKEIRSEMPHLRLTETEKSFAVRFLRKHQIQEKQLLVGVHPGARIATRRWDVGNFAAVARRMESEFNAEILWFTDPANADEPECFSPSWIRVALPFREFVAVLSRCHLLICNDSGPMHLAAAAGVPVVAVFGPTQPVWFGPLGRGNRIVIRPEFWCRPCFDYCIFDEPYCIRSITVEEVFNAATESLRALGYDMNSADAVMAVPNTTRNEARSELPNTDASLSDLTVKRD